MVWWQVFLTQIFKSWFVFWNLQFHRVSNRGMKKSITYLLTYNFRHQHIGKMFNNNSKNRSPPTLTLLLHFRIANFFPVQKVVWQQQYVLSQQQFAKMHKLLKACIFNLVALQGEGKMIIKINHNNKLSIFDIYPSEKK